MRTNFIFIFAAIVLVSLLYISHSVIKSKSKNYPISENEISNLSHKDICKNATDNGEWEINSEKKHYVDEAKRRGLSCGIIHINN